MSDRQDPNTCHKKLTKNVTGVMREPRENYGKWAYWCGQRDLVVAGWSSKPCKHHRDDGLGHYP